MTMILFLEPNNNGLNIFDFNNSDHGLCHFDSDMMWKLFLRGLGTDVIKSSLSFMRATRKLTHFASISAHVSTDRCIYVKP